MKRKAFAKINLGLRVLEKRRDGFHNIQSLMIPIGWHDELEFSKSESLSLTCTDESLPVDETNLCVQAALALQQQFDFVGVRIHLDKRVPHGAGLGGGSSDAAATLGALRQLWNLSASDEDLEEIAASLGSDIPFFISGRPSLVSGRGEILNPVELDLEGWLAVAVPEVPIATADAYGWVTPDASRPDMVVPSYTLSPTLDVHNDFQPEMVRRFPVVGELVDTFKAAGAVHVSMSGSGSAVYGIFADEVAARNSIDLLNLPGVRTWVGSVGLPLAEN